MTSVRQQLQPASFRGVPFLVNSESKEGGKKTQTHEFVNSDKRFTEEFGILPPRFTMQAIVHGDLNDRLNLERVLNIEGLGTLVHPVYGSVQVKSTTYTVSSAQTAIGEFRFSLTFEASEENVTAEPLGITASAVSAVADDARAALDAALEEVYAEPENSDTLDNAAIKAEEIYDKVNESISATVGAVEDKAATFTRIIEDNKANVYIYVQQASTITGSLTDMYTAALQVVETPSELLAAWESLLEFGIDESIINTITVPRLNKEINRSSLNEHTRVTGLISLFEAASYVEYRTDKDLEKVQKLLDEQYKSQIESYSDTISDEIVPLVTNSTVRQKISELRVKTKQVLDEAEQNVWKVVEISPGTSSMLLSTYRYYGDLDNFDFVKDLNPGTNSSNFKKPIQAVTR